MFLKIKHNFCKAHSYESSPLALLHITILPLGLLVPILRRALALILQLSLSSSILDPHIWKQRKTALKI